MTGPSSSSSSSFRESFRSFARDSARSLQLSVRSCVSSEADDSSVTTKASFSAEEAIARNSKRRVEPKEDEDDFRHLVNSDKYGSMAGSRRLPSEYKPRDPHPLLQENTRSVVRWFRRKKENNATA
eukprot:CAMPEP_0118713070 /NCGR_PEP_ID=MMETSP0800-20121206/25257_1 /TAXON_ID=210618 ORGANISM="Striatella unipunctata, Strain CCMP2910" /NCGR_SAMPLE_ID=MMETSP0800 /ASSEMBLY_ACC=CAM_ASM_000638 /LENGTH=125 /DNA_ID=CAMNT_0006618371 /DNA_START=199 /DNA_END=576 /DNA_ORIENTATION=+